MSILVAGLGNIFRTDDAFGVEAVREVSRWPLPLGVRTVDFGLRGVHLAFDLLEPPDLLIVADAVSRGVEPGTLVVLDPAEWAAAVAEADNVGEGAHSLDLQAVLQLLIRLGGEPPPMCVVGCEPASLEDGVGLTASVQAAIEPAAAVITRLITRYQHPTGELPGVC
jgi:hydrogenase maturation protease